MRKKNVLMSAIAALAFAACSSDDVLLEQDTGIVTNPTGNAWVALDIKTPSVSRSRALHDPNKEDGTAEESSVSTVRAIFFDASEQLTDDIELTGVEAGNPGQPNGGVSKPFKVDAKSKRILIIANPGAGFPAKGSFGTGASYSTVNGVLALSLGADVTQNVAKNGSFMMSNAKGRLEPSVSTTDGTDADLALYKTEELAKNSPLAIHIDRVVAKVRVYVKQESDVATIANPKWILNITNTKFFPVSERILTWNEDPANGGRGTCITPFDQYKIGSYRKDPNYDNQNGGLDYMVISNDVAIVNDSGESQYCLENTQTSIHNLHQYTTQVLLKVEFLPKAFKKPHTTNLGTPDPNKDFMRINGGFYTFDTLKEWIEAELRSKYDATGTSKPSVTTTLTDALNVYLDSKGIGKVSLLDSGVNVDALVITFNGKIDEIKGKGAGAVENFNYYADGISYYKIMIKHDDTDKALNELGEFGVVRNSVYDINVNKFNNPGYPEIPTPGTDPDEEDGSFLAIQINVNPWTWYTQEEEF